MKKKTGYTDNLFIALRNLQKNPLLKLEASRSRLLWFLPFSCQKKRTEFEKKPKDTFSINWVVAGSFWKCMFRNERQVHGESVVHLRVCEPLRVRPIRSHSISPVRHEVLVISARFERSLRISTSFKKRRWIDISF